MANRSAKSWRGGAGAVALASALACGPGGEQALLLTGRGALAGDDAAARQASSGSCDGQHNHDYKNKDAGPPATGHLLSL